MKKSALFIAVFALVLAVYAAESQAQHHSSRGRGGSHYSHHGYSGHHGSHGYPSYHRGYRGYTPSYGNYRPYYGYPTYTPYYCTPDSRGGAYGNYGWRGGGITFGFGW